MQKLTLQQMEDLLAGAAILGTGGGGSLTRGLREVREAVERGLTLYLVDVKELGPDDWVGSPYYAGAVAPDAASGAAEPGGATASGAVPNPADLPAEPEATRAFRALARYLGVPFKAVLATELGGGNTASAMVAAMQLGLPILDADPAGRAVPELGHTTFALTGRPIAPMAVTNRQGDVAILTEVAGHDRAEALVRAMAQASGNMVGVTDHPLPASRLKDAVIPGTLSRCLRIGQALREAQEAGDDPVEAVRRAGEGYRLFHGRTVRATWAIERGFTFGEIQIQGLGAVVGSAYRVKYQNEHMVAWRDGVIDATIPDLIVLLHRDTGLPVINPAAREGDEVEVLAFKAPAAWRSPRGLAIFGPAYAGVPADYVPIEMRHSR